MFNCLIRVNGIYRLWLTLFEGENLANVLMTDSRKGLRELVVGGAAHKVSVSIESLLHSILNCKYGET